MLLLASFFFHPSLSFLFLYLRDLGYAAAMPVNKGRARETKARKWACFRFIRDPIQTVNECHWYRMFKRAQKYFLSHPLHTSTRAPFQCIPQDFFLAFVRGHKFNSISREGIKKILNLSKILPSGPAANLGLKGLCWLCA